MDQTGADREEANEPVRRSERSGLGCIVEGSPRPRKSRPQAKYGDMHAVIHRMSNAADEDNEFSQINRNYR